MITVRLEVETDLERVVVTVERDSSVQAMGVAHLDGPTADKLVRAATAAMGQATV